MLNCSELKSLRLITKTTDWLTCQTVITRDLKIRSIVPRIKKEWNVHFI